MSKQEGGKKFAERMKEIDPDYFKKLGKLGSKSVKTPYHHFSYLKETDPEKLREMVRQIGKKNKGRTHKK
jgi:hypothetical protein